MFVVIKEEGMLDCFEETKTTSFNCYDPPIGSNNIFIKFPPFHRYNWWPEMQIGDMLDQGILLIFLILSTRQEERCSALKAGRGECLISSMPYVNRLTLYLMFTYIVFT